MEENANELHFDCIDEYPSPVISHGETCGSAACPLDSRLKSLTVSTFSSVQALRSLPLPGRLSTVPASRNFFNSLLTPSFVQLFSGNLSVNLFAMYPLNYKHFLSKSCPRRWIQGLTPRLYDWTVSSEHLGFCFSFFNAIFVWFRAAE